VLDRFGLADLVKRRAGGPSGGQKRRLVFLDGPSTGLDVEGWRALWDGVREFHAEGGTIEVEALARRVVVIGGGRVLADDIVPAVRNMVAIRRGQPDHGRTAAVLVGCDPRRARR